jgi:hypothetical protein
MGAVHVKLNLAGDTNFSNAQTQWLTISQPIINKLGYFKLSALVPDVQCTGPNNTCTIQLYTDSGGGWYSCTTVRIVCDNCTGGVPVSRDDCVNAGDLPFCSAKSGSQVLVPQGQNAAQIDSLTKDSFDQNHPNPNVFTKGNSTACMTQYQQMLCELYLAPCGNSSSTYTQQMCTAALSTCGLTAGEEHLYNCSVFPSASKSSTTAKSTSTTTTKSTTTTTAKSTTTTTAKSTTTTTTAKSTTGATSAKATTTTTTTAKSTTTGSKSAFIRNDNVPIDFGETNGTSHTISFQLYALDLALLWLLL